jgi:hypothetical protein
MIACSLFFLFSGDTKMYIAIDLGNTARLNMLPALEKLHLKVDAPVVLLQNLSDELVNGLRGRVQEMTEDCVTVLFENHTNTTRIRPFIFSIYDPKKGANIATRTQIPLRLAFALTVHKAQGMTIERLIVDGRHMNRPGHLGVAIGRATCIANVKVINYTRKGVTKHPEMLYEYNSEVQMRMLDDLSCCRNIYINVPNVCTSSQKAYSEISLDYDSQDTSSPDCLISEQEVAQLIATDTPSNEVNPLLTLPDDEALREMLSHLFYDVVKTDEQKIVNEVLQSLLDDLGGIKRLVKFIMEQLQILGLREGISNKDTSAFYGNFHEIMETQQYKAEVCHLLKTTTPNGTQTNAIHKFIAKLRNIFVKKITSPIMEQQKKELKEKCMSHNLDLRLVGGRLDT